MSTTFFGLEAKLYVGRLSKFDVVWMGNIQYE